jgi:hypothetical protein
MLLAFVALPSTLALIGLQGMVEVRHIAVPGSDELTTVAFYYLVAILPVVLAGIAHQWLWINLPATWGLWRRRTLAFACAPIIPLAVWLFWRGDLQMIRWFAWPIALGLLLYVIIMQPPERSADGLNHGDR